MLKREKTYTFHTAQCLKKLHAKTRLTPGKRQHRTTIRIDISNDKVLDKLSKTGDVVVPGCNLNLFRLNLMDNNEIFIFHDLIGPLS